MNDPETITEILGLYKKHGWVLRRVLLSRPAGAAAPDVPADQFSGAEVRDADIDALWFSRPARDGNVAWELRALTPTPFALLELIPEKAGDAEQQRVFAEVENRMREMLVRGSTKDN